MDILKQIIEFLKANKADENLIKSAEGLKTISPDSVKDYLEKDEAGKKFLSQLKDAAVTKGIDTFKEKTMPGLIEEEIKKKFPDETADQKKLRELEDNQKRLQNEIKRKDLLSKATSLAVDKKLPLKLIEKFLGEDEESTLRNIDEFESVYTSAIADGVEAKFKDNGRGGDDDKKNPPAGDLSKLSDSEYFAERLKK